MSLIFILKLRTEIAKARQLQSGADLSDLDFVEKESGVTSARDSETANVKHAQNMESKEYDRRARMDEKEHDRLSGLDKAAFDSLTKTQGGV